ncbi:MAG: hypothetical protein IPM54_11835 [Polyangiaceae bacterium]|nr:hypothetical protein [Polyangiaceae bacterium]
MKASRMVADRVAISNTVLAAVDNHGPKVAPALDALLFPNGVPPNLNMAGVLTAIHQYLAKTTTTLVDADTAHAIELQDDDPYRKQREESITDLRAYLISLRATLTSNYGAAIASAYGCSAAIPEDAHTLVRFATNVEELLRTRPLTETPKKKSLTIDPSAAADDLKEARETLETALGNVEREKRESQLTQVAKNNAMAVWGTAYPRAADCIAALFALAGQEELANAVKPTARRRAGLTEAEDTPDAATPPANPPTNT